MKYGNKKQTIKLIDFGMSYFSEGQNLIDIEYICGTLGYRAPEQENNKKMNYKSDIYAMAVSIIELWNGDIWYEGNTFKECRKEVLRGLRTIEKQHSELGRLLRKSINLKHSKRPNSKRFLSTLQNIISNNHHIYKTCLHDSR